VGEATEAYQPLIRLVDSRQCRFECNLEASDAVKLRLDQRVRLRLDTGAEPVTVEGTVVFLSPVADKASGLINMKVLFDNASGALRPGLSGQLLLFNSN
jgi:multidrug efflux pump subunit AcrA (membrane-fusion protein)